MLKANNKATTKPTRKNRKVSTFEFGTSEINNNSIAFYINKALFNSLEERFIRQTNDKSLEEKNKYLELESTDISDKEVVLKYSIPQNYQSLRKIKKEDYLVKLLVAQRILKDDVLNDEKYKYVSLNPNTLFYQNINKIQYSYRANEVMPYTTNESKLKRYKAIVLYILTNYSYEKAINSFEPLLNSKPTDLIKAIIHAENINELKLLLDVSVEKNQHKKIKNEAKRKKRKLRNALAITLFTLLSVVLLSMFLNKHAIEENRKMAKEHEKALNDQKVEYQIKNETLQKNHEKVADLMEENNYPLEKRLDHYKKHNMYQRILDNKPSEIEYVISDMYENNKKKEILDLKLKSKKKNDKYANKLKQEKNIVVGELDSVMNELAFVEDKNTARRLGLAYLKENEIEQARAISLKFNDKLLKLKIEKIENEEELEKLKNNKKKYLKNSSANSSKLKLTNQEISNINKKLKRIDEKIKKEK